MNTPLLAGLLGEKAAAQLTNIITDFEKAVADKHIWNTDFQTGKDWLSRRCEEATRTSFAQQIAKRDHTYQRPQWESSDVRWYTVYTPQFSNMPGAVKKLQKFKDAPQVADVLPLFTEIAGIAELVKAAKPFIEKGRKPNPDAKPIDLTNTGTCAICYNLQKLNSKQAMVHHGYQISDGYGHYFGFRSGTCFGVGRKPYELSNEANVAYKAILDRNLGDVQKRLRGLKDGTVTEIVRMEYASQSFGQHRQVPKVYHKGDDKWDAVLWREIKDVEAAIRAVESEIERQQERIKQWARKPLPHGEGHGAA